MHRTFIFHGVVPIEAAKVRRSTEYVGVAGEYVEPFEEKYS